MTKDQLKKEFKKVQSIQLFREVDSHLVDHNFLSPSKRNLFERPGEFPDHPKKDKLTKGKVSFMEKRQDLEESQNIILNRNDSKLSLPAESDQEIFIFLDYIFNSLNV